MLAMRSSSDRFGGRKAMAAMAVIACLLGGVGGGCGAFTTVDYGPAPVARTAAAKSNSTTANSASAPASRPLRVLFIGNSYTFYNGGLGRLVQQLAHAAKGAPPVEFVEVTRGGQTLEGHWKQGAALEQIRKGNWDYVVLQEHSQRPITDRDKMWEYARLFSAEVRKVGGKIVFFETWARKTRPETQDTLNSAYEGIAREVGATVAPAGPSWERAQRANPRLSLHQLDNSHPTPAGSYLNACVMYGVLMGRSPEGLPRTLRTDSGKVLVEVSEAEATALQKAAAETLGRRTAE